MIKSMTGYGSASKDLDNGKYTVELKSLNSKFLELNIKLPKAFSDLHKKYRTPYKSNLILFVFQNHFRFYSFP